VQKIAVMSGKGGVGKSFVSAGLATALQRCGVKVGVLDADVIGASIPRMYGLDARLHVNDKQKIIPAETKSGVKVISISLALPSDDKAVIWRGPMISNAISQFYDDADWSDVDVLVIDLPPGTSDAALTVLQSIKPEGIVVVATPQDLVRTIARKSVDMAMHIGARVVGAVENMTYVSCPHCGEQVDLFGASDAEKGFRDVGIDLLASLPLLPDASMLADEGRIEDLDPELLSGVADAVVSFLETAPEPEPSA